jgi:nitrogen fixation protein FixH
MTSMAITIPAGVLLLLFLYMLFYRFTPLNAKQSGFVISLLAMAIYFPVALIYWPGADVLAMNITVFFMAAYLMGMLFSHREKIKAQDDPELRGKWFHWGPAIIVGFFAVILIVDAIFVTVSKEGLPGGLQDLLIPERMQSKQVETRFPGVMHNNYHKKETKYNRYLRQLELMQQRGWQVHKGWLHKTPSVNETGIFQLVIKDASGTAISGMVAGGRFMRASDSRHDIVFSMQEKMPGVYQSELRLSEPGLWNVNINFTHAGEDFELHASTNILKAGER